MEEVKLMNLYTVVVYDLSICMKEDNSGSTFLREIISIVGQRVSVFVICLTVLILIVR